MAIHASTASFDRKLGWLVKQSYMTGALVAALMTVTWHRRWEQSLDGTPERGLMDGLCHLGTAAAVALPALPYVRDRAGFLRMVLLSAVAYDLDHIPAARSVRLERTMTMANRPASHSALVPILLAILTERWRPQQHLGLAALLGMG